MSNIMSPYKLRGSKKDIIVIRIFLIFILIKFILIEYSENDLLSISKIMFMLRLPSKFCNTFQMIYLNLILTSPPISKVFIFPNRTHMVILFAVVK